MTEPIRTKIQSVDECACSTEIADSELPWTEIITFDFQKIWDTIFSSSLVPVLIA
jgi:hypothetical protein